MHFVKNMVALQLALTASASGRPAQSCCVGGLFYGCWRICSTGMGCSVAEMAGKSVGGQGTPQLSMAQHLYGGGGGGGNAAAPAAHLERRR